MTQASYFDDVLSDVLASRFRSGPYTVSASVLAARSVPGRGQRRPSPRSGHSAAGASVRRQSTPGPG